MHEYHYEDVILVFDIATRSKVSLYLDKWPDQSLGGVYFNHGGIFTSDKSDYLWILRRNRTWDEVDVVKANTTTGEAEVLWSEKSEPYHNTRYSQDRKSTRLNSSHVAISYAVFCSKKTSTAIDEGNNR